MDVVVIPLFHLIDTVIQLYIYVLVASAVLSWLVAFNVVNTYNGFVHGMMTFTDRLTEPVLRRVRHYLPATGGMDFSPMVLILILVLVQEVLSRLAHKLV